MVKWFSEDTPYIEIFGFHHIIYMLILLTSLILLITFRKQIKKHRETFSIIFLVISVLQQIMLYNWYVLETDFNLNDALPFHICRIATLLGIVFLITKNLHVLEIAFYFGLFAYGSFIYPSRIHPVYHVMGISFVINHTLTILLPYFAYIAYNWRPKLKGMFRAYGYFLIYFIFVYLFNPLVDGNYFYLKYRPFLENLPEYIYVPGNLIVVFIGFYLANLVVRLIGNRREKVILNKD